MIWTILGVSVAIVAVFCVTVAELLVGHRLFEQYRGYIALTLAISGVAAWFVGRFLGKRRQAKESDEDKKIFVLFDLRYWGPMFLTLGVITLFIQTIKLTKDSAAALPPAPKKTEPPKQVEVVAKPPPPIAPGGPVSFPTLKVQGIIFRDNHSSVILNGRSYEEGDLVGDVTVKEITREAVKLEKSGEVKLFFLAGDPRGTSLMPDGR